MFRLSAWRILRVEGEDFGCDDLEIGTVEHAFLRFGC